MIHELVTTRSQVVEYLRRELLGPHDGEDEILQEEPYVRYTTGVLYPRDSSNGPAIEEDEISGVSSKGELESQGDDPIVLANQYLPSSMGLSFYLCDDPRISVQFTGARYCDAQLTAVLPTEKKAASRRRCWQRIPVIVPELLVPPLRNDYCKQDKEILNGAARICVVWRPSSTGWLVTVTVINNSTRAKSLPEVEDCLYQVKVHCKPVGQGYISAYPQAKMITNDPEEQILNLLYRHQITYGVGHGCSVNWKEPTHNSTSEIWTEIIPQQEVSPIIYDLTDDYSKILSLQFLSSYVDSNSPTELIKHLSRFVEGYQRWINTLVEQHQDIPADLEDARKSLLDRLQKACERMREGVGLLENDSQIRRAFCLANRAMLMQMVHSLPEYAGTRRTANEQAYKEPGPQLASGQKWRPFQLAFQLLTIGSVAFSDHPDRKTVDLIWFPTGGGKTEAYLAVTAFLIFYRRMAYRANGYGTSVLMRYTLRLLTIQQFRRASTLICACEEIRRSMPQELGSKEISVGLWVGEATTPNRYQDAYDAYTKLLKQDEPESHFQLDRCPWCGTEIVPARLNARRDVYGIRSTVSSFELFCPSRTCPFHNRLPVGVVDEQLYDSLPALLLGTVDKFARMPWEERAVKFFGGDSHRPPELVIQDELHLISGPLGTIVGVYETAIDALTSWNGDAPKIIASTATIRRAEEQCMGLYARNVEQFPPSGLDASDSYFARYDRSMPGRLYVGVLGAAYTASTTMIRTSAALLQAPVDLQLEDKKRDAYWTLVAYHNNLREQGKSRTFGADNIPARIKVIAHDQKYRRDLNDDNVQELTSHINAVRLAGVLERLERPAEEDGEVSLLLCTNMFSVGVDVQRLGMMLVHGQPKSTSEYIQATSRVGRGAVPGLVVCVYGPSKPRDRSHYERFVAYHSSLYRQVEPTSVTPFAQPARERALHAVLVALVRYKTELSKNEDAGRFSSLTLAEIQRIAQLITERVSMVDVRELASTDSQVQRLLTEWEDWATRTGWLEYCSRHEAKESLLFDAGENRERLVGWPTLQSMRTIEVDCLVKIMRGSI